MVVAEEKQINAIINTVKNLPVECKNFDTADAWVGIVIELENILANKGDDDTHVLAPKCPDPSEYIVKDGVDLSQTEQ